MTHVHLWTIGRPEPRCDIGNRTARMSNFETSRIRLPEILYAQRKSALEVSNKRQTRSALARCRREPGAFRIRSFHNRESFGSHLCEFEVVPNRVLSKLSTTGERLTRFLGDAPTSRLKRFRPHASISTNKSHCTVSCFLAKWYSELHTESAHEIFFLIPIESYRMNHPH